MSYYLCTKVTTTRVSKRGTSYGSDRGKKFHSNGPMHRLIGRAFTVSLFLKKVILMWFTGSVSDSFCFIENAPYKGERNFEIS